MTPAPAPAPLVWERLPLVLTNRHVAEILHKSEKTVRDDASRAPWRLPPRLQIPGTAHVRYSRDAVRQWLDGLTPSQPTPPPPALARRRGRPRGTSSVVVRALRHTTTGGAANGR